MLKECKVSLIKQIRQGAESAGASEQEICHICSEVQELVAKEPEDLRYEEDPRLTGRAWEILCSRLSCKDPYASVKAHYDELGLELAAQARKKIAEIKDCSTSDSTIDPGAPAIARATTQQGSATPEAPQSQNAPTSKKTRAHKRIRLALSFAALGNLIDFGTSDGFSDDDLARLAQRAHELHFALDDSSDLIECALRSQTLTYVADNCGELALDAVLIEELKRANPALQVTYLIREKPILNDVTMSDVEKTQLNRSVERVLSNGDALRGAGTLLDQISKEALEALQSADLVISKGQGNIEGLRLLKHEQLYFVLMAKIDYIARLCGCVKGDLLCMRRSRLKNPGHEGENAPKQS